MLTADGSADMAPSGVCEHPLWSFVDISKRCSTVGSGTAVSARHLVSDVPNIFPASGGVLHADLRRGRCQRRAALGTLLHGRSEPARLQEKGGAERCRVY